VPKVGVMVWVAEVRPVEAKVRVYWVPAVPLIPALVKVTTPLTAFTVVVPTMVPLLFTVMVTEAELLVTVLPKASRMVITGCVVNADPLAEPAAWVVNASCVAVPKVGVMVWVAEVRPVEAKLRVYWVPAVPLIPTLVKVAMPLIAFMVVVPRVVAPELTAMVTAALLLVTVLPKASWMMMTGWVLKADPLEEPAAWVVSASCVAVP